MIKHKIMSILIFIIFISNTLCVNASTIKESNIKNENLPKLKDYETYEIIDDELYVAVDYTKMMSEREKFDTYTTSVDYSIGDMEDYISLPKQSDGITPEVGWEWSSHYNKFVKCSNDGINYGLHTGQDYELYYCDDTCSTCSNSINFECDTCSNCDKLEDWLVLNTITDNTKQHIKIKNIEIPLSSMPFPITYFESGSGYITNTGSTEQFICYWSYIQNEDGSPVDSNCNYNPNSWEVLVNNNDNAPICWFKCDSLDYCNYDDHLYRLFDESLVFEGFDDITFGPAPDAPLTLPNSDMSMSGAKYNFSGRGISYTGRVVGDTLIQQNCNRGNAESKSKNINFNINGSAFIEYTVWVDGCNHMEVAANVDVSGTSKIERIAGNDASITSRIQGNGVYVCSDKNNTGWTRYRHTLDGSNSHRISYRASSARCGTKVKKVTTVNAVLMDVKIYYKVYFNYNSGNKTIGNDSKYNNTDAAIRYEDELLWTESNPNPKYRPFPRPLAYYTVNLYPSGSNGTYTTSFDEPSWDFEFLSKIENTPTQSHNTSGVNLRTDNGLKLPQLNTTETKYWGQDGKSLVKTKYWASRVYQSFEGWWTSAIGGNQKISTDTVNSSGTLYSHWVNNSITIPTPKRRYEITYDTCGGNFVQEDNIIGHDDYSYKGTISDSFIGENNSYTDENGNKVTYENKRYTTGGEVSFLGWYDQSQIVDCWFKPNQNGNIYDPNQVGSYRLEKVLINNKIAYRYTPIANTNMYAHWILPNISLPYCYKLGYEFLGWYTIPQPSIDDMQSGNMSIARYAGGHPETNDKLLKSSEIGLNMDNETNIHLYAWYNKKPIFVDIYEGLFFEGQQVTYNDLLSLVGVVDYEDNYLELQQKVIEEFFKEKINKIDQDITVDKNLEEHKILEKDTWIYKKELADEGEHNSDDYAHILENIDRLNEEIAKLRDKIAKLFKEKEQLEQEREKALESIPERARLLDVYISEIDYYGVEDTPKYIDNHRTADETSCGIFRAPNYKEMNYEENRLKTNTDNIGKFEIIYQVHDEGIKFRDTDNVIKQIPKSDVTIEYTRTCQINFNYNPLLYTQGVIKYTSEVNNTFADSIKLQQAVFDSEDTQDNIPWWGKYEVNSESEEVDSETGEHLIRKLLHDENDDTIKKLQQTLVITGVTNFKFTTAFAYEHQDVIDKFIDEFNSPEGKNSYYSEEIGKCYTNGDKQPILDKSKLLNYIASFKGDTSEYINGVTKDEVWRALTNIYVTFDAIDQWGKMASNSVTEKAHDDENTFVDTMHTPAGYIPEYNSGNDTGDNNPDKNKPYDKVIYQSEPERSVCVVILNDDDKNTLFIDNTLFKGLIKDNIRYINTKWLDTLGTSYWGTYGKEALQNILQKKIENGIQHKGYYNTTNKNKVTVNIEDYSK